MGMSLDDVGTIFGIVGTVFTVVGTVIIVDECKSRRSAHRRRGGPREADESGRPGSVEAEARAGQDEPVSPPADVALPQPAVLPPLRPRD
ncbi:hypothetical protein SPBR_09065 [Sporothrix brasiliensis 5110]|uniref:Uncharacterized protein n=1 Tax=Sporothrix brasiliensis 5110 TaxID=1398154 RepID=A0A0C2FFU1_9PEZI|nr:uncharacterized protein SPBR_09065 [Sporothrix brasiliensis 5110]KIH89993.1 hypothetical protein SPBR_09065 [Sporothrix brasiliensis 5110]